MYHMNEPSLPFMAQLVNPSYGQPMPYVEYYPPVPNPTIMPTLSASQVVVVGVIGTNKGKEKVENEKLSAPEERLRAIEGLNMYGSIDAFALRLVPNVIVPPKFKVPKFEKYSGTLDPHIHLATYIAKMSALTEDDKLLIHFFHESLSGPALRWYVQLDRSKLHS
ncbi:hypothetical protein P3X46_018230 [Hevea brasiliensis]|uniref:Retrotransposon gag domain-containing protein n=1 Tax=Hevea brasiliensis TaxID=3981 RepID=A0ABQ9LS76_HEVBR|nr:hypothetical protein P3X46_018230 [Hevea brasiliensis]